MELFEQLNATNKLPSLIVFDLDYTIWPLWIDTHVSGPPFTADPSRPYTVSDRRGNEIKLYDDIPAIISLIKNFPDIKIGLASRTAEPTWAKDAVSIMPFPSNDASGESQRTTLSDFVDYSEIYPGSKVRHFKKMHMDSGIPYQNMIFFDDELRNKDVQDQLGVQFVNVPHGLSMLAFLRGIERYAGNKTD